MHNLRSCHRAPAPVAVVNRVICTVHYHTRIYTVLRRSLDADAEIGNLRRTAHERAMDVPSLLTERLLLTVPGQEAAPRYAQFCRENSAFLEPWQGPFYEREFAVDFWQSSLERRQQAFAADRGYSFGIFWRGAGLQGPLLGYCNFSEIVRGLFQACYVGYALGESSQNKGIMTEALAAGIDYIWTTVKLHRIMANYMPHNTRSAAVLKRLGFKIEGTAEKYLYINGAWRDHVLTALTNPAKIIPPQAL